jgi:hypothetical protein
VLADGALCLFEDLPSAFAHYRTISAEAA